MNYIKCYFLNFIVTLSFLLVLPEQSWSQSTCTPALNLSFVSITNSEVNMTWDESPNAGSYLIEYFIDGALVHSENLAPFQSTHQYIDPNASLAMATSISVELTSYCSDGSELGSVTANTETDIYTIEYWRQKCDQSRSRNLLSGILVTKFDFKTYDIVCLCNKLNRFEDDMGKKEWIEYSLQALFDTYIEECFKGYPDLSRFANAHKTNGELVTLIELRNGSEALKIQLYDLNGRLVLSEPMTASELNFLSKGQLPAGIYFYHLIYLDGSIYKGVLSLL